MKWVQDASENIVKEDGHVLFIGGPPVGIGMSDYKDFPSNESFISTKNLNDMVISGNHKY